MKLLEVNNVSFRYPEASGQVLDNVSLQVEAGDFVVLCGPSGCGKTTLLRLIKKELEPVGRKTGTIMYGGAPLEQLNLRQSAQEIGMVQQHPDNQIVSEEVAHELYFALENISCPQSEMQRRVAEISHAFGLERLNAHKTYELSGGQKQLVNLAAVLVLRPKLLLLDEPTAQLDPVAAHEFLHILRRLNEEFGTTIIMTEHRLEDVFPLADRVLYMEQGSIRYSGSPGQVVESVWGDIMVAKKGDNAHQQYRNVTSAGSRFLEHYVPTIPKLYVELCGMDRKSSAVGHGGGHIPLTVKDGRRWLNSLPEFAEPYNHNGELAAKEKNDGEVVLECSNVSFQYNRKAPFTLRQASLVVRHNDVLVLVGGNGSGKSTLLQVLAGLLIPQEGKVKLNGKPIRQVGPAERYRIIGYLAQNPLLHFAYETVQEELERAADRAGFPKLEGQAEIDRLAEHYSLTRLFGIHPHDLSGGERQLLALAGILLSRPQLLLIDEPTKGLDPLSKRKFGEEIQRLSRSGTTVVMVTHDIEFAARYATRCCMLHDGGVSVPEPPRRFFSANSFYTTTVNRLVRDLLPDAILSEDVMQAWYDNVRVPSLFS